MAVRVPEPAVTRKTLIRSAAVAWGIAGLFLSVRAVAWLPARIPAALGLILLALSLGTVKGRLVFARLAVRNIRRILALSPHKERICLFAFQAVQSYVVILGMMGLGMVLRLAPIPRPWLALLYLAIGSGLVIGSLPYWRAAGGFGAPARDTHSGGPAGPGFRP